LEKSKNLISLRCYGFGVLSVRCQPKRLDKLNLLKIILVAASQKGGAIFLKSSN